MKTYRVKVEHGDDGWLVAEGINLRGLVTQGRDLDELASMVRDAIEALTESKSFAVELLIPSPTKARAGQRSATRKRRRKAA